MTASVVPPNLARNSSVWTDEFSLVSRAFITITSCHLAKCFKTKITLKCSCTNWVNVFHTDSHSRELQLKIL